MADRSHGQSVEFEGCQASFAEGELLLANAHIERRWRVQNGLLYAQSYRDLGTGREWLAKPAEQPAPYPAAPLPEEPRQVRFQAQGGRFSPVEEPSLLAELTAEGATATLTYRFRLFPGARGVVAQLDVRNAVAATGPASAATGSSDAPTGIEADPQAPAGAEVPPCDVLESLLLAPRHLRLTQVCLRDQTDRHNELLFENEWLLHPNEAELALDGNLFMAEDTLSGDGLLFLKHAPLPHARPVPSSPDLRAHARSRAFRFLGHGADPAGGEGYRYVVLSYTGGCAGRVEALQSYQRQLRAYQPGRDGMLLSNTWGDRSRDARICDAFMRLEVDAGARLGVDVVQIDDGWQAGLTSNSAEGKGVWEGFWAADSGFWQAHPRRFPDGLDPIIALAKERGLRFGLWFAPDSTDDFANWERDADVLLGCHRRLGIDYFKIDGVKVRTKAGEGNLRRFFDRILRESEGRVTFDLDVTAEVRPGYFGLPDTGPLFVENRYTDWQGYWPHQTLRNLWKLAHYVDPLRLRMEFLNNRRNLEQYGEDPLAPASYRPAYLFAITMMANPLGWFEVSSLPPAYFDEVAPLVAVWKQHREALFSGRTIPIGEAPDGTSWTGFVSVGDDRESGYLLLFREYNQRPQYCTPVPVFPSGRFTCEPLAGNGDACITDGVLYAELERAQDFLFARIRRA